MLLILVVFCAEAKDLKIKMACRFEMPDMALISGNFFNDSDIRSCELETVADFDGILV